VHIGVMGIGKGTLNITFLTYTINLAKEVSWKKWWRRKSAFFWSV